MKPLPVVPSCRSVERIADRCKDELDAMAALLLSERRLRGGVIRHAHVCSDESLKCLLVAPIFKATPETLSIAVARSTRRSGACIALLRWPDGLFASLQLRYASSRSDSTSSNWEPLTLASGNTARALLSTYRKSQILSDLRLIAISHLRFQALLVRQSGSLENRLKVVDSGISSTRRNIYYGLRNLVGLLKRDETRFAVAHQRATSKAS